MALTEKRVILQDRGKENSASISVYEQGGGYEALKQILQTEKDKWQDPNAIIEEVKKSGLRGRGGAGFPAGMKWKFLDRKSGKPIYLICNADESEPGTFKDRQIIHKDPHQLIEGILCSAYAIQAKLV